MMERIAYLSISSASLRKSIFSIYKFKYKFNEIKQMYN